MQHTRRGAEKEGEVPPESRQPYLSTPPAPSSPGPLEEARRSADDLFSFFRSLGTADRWAAGASAGLLLALILPWRWSQDDDDVIGLVAAWPVGVLAAAVVTLIYVRARRAGSALSRRLRAGQLGAASLAALLAAAFVPWVGTPLAGSYLGLACAVAALIASLPAFREER